MCSGCGEDDAVGLNCLGASVVGFDTCGGCGDALVMKESCFAEPHTCDFRSGCEP